MHVEFTENLEFALVRVLYKRNDSAFPNGYLHNNCNVAPVRAFRLSPSKLQTRSTGQAPTPSNSHSMRITLL